MLGEWVMRLRIVKQTPWCSNRGWRWDCERLDWYGTCIEVSNVLMDAFAEDSLCFYEFFGLLPVFQNNQTKGNR